MPFKHCKRIGKLNTSSSFCGVAYIKDSFGLISVMFQKQGKEAKPSLHLLKCLFVFCKPLKQDKRGLFPSFHSLLPHKP